MFAMTKAVAMLGLTTLALTGCGESAETPGEAVTDRTGEAAPRSADEPRSQPETEPAQQPRTGPAVGEVTSVETPVIDGEGKEIGSLSIEPAEQGLRLTLHVEGLSPGPHAVHFHEHGRCDPPEFQSAGGHYNPADAQHGMPDMDEDAMDQDHHVGDMLNQDVGDQGTLDTVLINYPATLTQGPTTLLDEDGSALVIHAEPDDYESQPSGNAGSRVACAVVSSAQATGMQ